MTFEEWWKKMGLDPAAKYVAKLAWFDAIKCPKCGGDLRRNVCWLCPPHDIEKYYKDGEV